MADKVDGIISFTAHIAQPIIPVAKEKGIIHIMSFWGTELADGKYNFLNWTQPEELVEKLVENIKAKGYKKVQSVCWLQQGVVALEKVLETELQKHNIDYDKAWVPGGERDMRLLIRKMQTNNPDLYIPVLFDPELSVFIKQLRDANIKTDVASMEVFSLINNPELINGAWFIDVADANTSAMQKIKQYNKSDATYGLGLMYDDVMLMVYAFENAPDKAAAAKVLSDLKEYDGISGKLTQVNGTFKSQGILKEIKEGKAPFHMLEVMACPGGCINGGGQPRSYDDSKIKGERAEGLYKEDAELPLRKSHFNPSIRKLYNEYLQEPNSHKAHELLHTIYTDKFAGSYKDI